MLAVSGMSLFGMKPDVALFTLQCCLHVTRSLSRVQALLLLALIVQQRHIAVFLYSMELLYSPPVRGGTFGLC